MTNTALTPHPHSIEPGTELTFESVYPDTVAFVWRTARRLGVGESGLETFCRDVFVEVHKRLTHFDRRGSLKAWVYSVLRDRVQVYRRKLANNNRPSRRRIPNIDAEYNELEDKTPYELVSTAQALRIAHEILELLSDEKREVFILVDLEKWPISEAALATGVDDKTAFSRLEIARKEFALAAHRVRIRDTLRGRDSWRVE